jgi:hypothetical protein
MATKITNGLEIYQNGYKHIQMAWKYTNIFHPQFFQNVAKLTFWYANTYIHHLATLIQLPLTQKRMQSSPS